MCVCVCGIGSKQCVDGSPTTDYIQKFVRVFLSQLSLADWVYVRDTVLLFATLNFMHNNLQYSDYVCLCAHTPNPFSNYGQNYNSILLEVITFQQ